MGILFAFWFSNLSWDKVIYSPCGGMGCRLLWSYIECLYIGGVL